MDETTVRVLHYDDAEKNQNRQKSYIWVAIGGPEKQKACVYRYYESRNSEFISLFINGFHGYLQTDEYQGYDTALEHHAELLPDDKITHICCLAHIRRRFNDALQCGVKRAAIAMKFIQWMYRLENKIQEMHLNDKEKVAERKKKIPISERAVKPFVMSRKNFLFCGSEDGARSSCLLFSLIECAKMNSINPEDYLRCLFDTAPYCVTESDFEQLLPWNIEIKPYVPQGTWMVCPTAEN